MGVARLSTAHENRRGFRWHPGSRKTAPRPISDEELAVAWDRVVVTWRALAAPQLRTVVAMGIRPDARTLYVIAAHG